MKTLLTSVNSSIAAEPASRPPLPVFLTPPNGSWTSAPMVGASGGRLLGNLLAALEDTGGCYGLQTMCESGGMANATLIQRL